MNLGIRMQVGTLLLQTRIRFSVVALATVLLVGCGQEQGANQFRVTGNVTFDGKPLPRGMIVFMPDLSKKNDGPQGVADIVDGKYDTSASGGQNVVGGPMQISVTGLSADGRPLCQYDFEAELPRADTTKDIEVPKSAASKNTSFEGP